MNLTTSTLSIPIAFVLLATVLLWLIIWSKGWWWLKMLAISAVLYFGVALSYSIETYLGWPCHEELPPLFVVHWAYAQEPSKKMNDPGAIYLLLRELEHKPRISYLNFLAFKGDDTQPRIYAFPYTKDDHARVQQIQEAVKEGRTIVGGKKAKKKGGSGKGKGKGKGKGEGPGQGRIGDNKYGGFSFSHSDEHYFHELPPASVPEKVRRN